MKKTLPLPILVRTGEADAEAALFSLPLPRGRGTRLHPAHPGAGAHPLAWWEKDREPRRVLAALSGRLPKTLKLRSRRPAPAEGPSPWTLAVPMTTERIPYVPHKFADIDGLRGVPAADCSTFEYALDLTFGGRTLRLQPGATGPGKAECLWQNVLIDPLWRHAGAEAVRVGGVIYNEDTYLWADLYLVLFANGVVHATLHYSTTKLHIKGYDFRGFPYLKIQGAGLKAVDADLPADGWRHDLGAARFNFADTAITCGPEYPATLRGRNDAVYYSPFARIMNPQKADSPDDLWEPGFARTIRFQFSLSDAAPAVARYTVPAWWYGVCGEPWAGETLPVRGRYSAVALETGRYVQSELVRGSFAGGSGCKPEGPGPLGNDGDTGFGLMQQAYLTGDAGLYRDALDFCTFWADLMVDHTDFTVHQWVGGWGWKTCAYTKFRDLLAAYLETGDPWMRDTVEMVAESYWAWFRSNWPRNAVGRDAFETGGWALLWKFFRTEHARERTKELARMLRLVIETRGVIGGQMGAGPHPGWHASLYMTGVTMISLLDAAQSGLEEDGAPASLLPVLERLGTHYNRDDVELFPSNLGKLPRPDWQLNTASGWAIFALRAFAELGRRYGFDNPVVRAGFERLRPSLTFDIKEWGRMGRLGNHHVHPRTHDMLMLMPRLLDDGTGLELAPAFGPATLPWPAEQAVDTPWGALTIKAAAEGEAVRLTFEAPADFAVRVKTSDGVRDVRSQADLTV